MMEIMKKTHEKSFIVRAEFGSQLEKHILSVKPHTIIDGDRVNIVVLQCQAISAPSGKNFILAEIIQKKDYEDIIK